MGLETERREMPLWQYGADVKRVDLIQDVPTRERDYPVRRCGLPLGAGRRLIREPGLRLEVARSRMTCHDAFACVTSASVA